MHTILRSPVIAPQPTPASRPLPRVAVLAALPARRDRIKEMLRATDLHAWAVPLQGDTPATILPFLDGPLVFDTRGWDQEELLILLAALSETTIPILAIVDHHDLRTRRLLTACPQIVAVVAALPTPQRLHQWATAAAVADRRTADQAVAHMSLAAPNHGLRESRLYAILWAMGRAAKLTHAADLCGVPRTTMMRLLKALRIRLDLHRPGKRARPEQTVYEVLAALAALPLDVEAAAVPCRRQRVKQQTLQSTAPQVAQQSESSPIVQDIQASAPQIVGQTASPAVQEIVVSVAPPMQPKVADRPVQRPHKLLMFGMEHPHERLKRGNLTFEAGDSGGILGAAGVMSG